MLSRTSVFMIITSDWKDEAVVGVHLAIVILCFDIIFVKKCSLLAIS